MTTKISKETIQKSFAVPEAYRSPLRDRRGEKLLHFLHDHIWLLPQGPWLDLGCSDGRTLHVAAKRGAVAPKGHFGVDLSKEMIARAHSNYPHLARWMIADFFDVPLADASVAGIISNSSLQWAQWQQGGLGAVLKEARRLLPKEAPLALALPGPGLVSDFLQSYQTIYRENPAWHSKEEFIPDPLSGPHLDLFLQELQEASFLPFFAETTLEGFTYSNSQEYIEEIASSSQEIFLAPFSQAKKEDAWREISLEFTENSDNPFFYESLATYIIARAL